MGNTVLASLSKTQSGLLLSESFESSTFMTDQAWTLNNGTPTISTAQSFDGVHSLQMDSTFPNIQKAFSQNFGWCFGYFYDDATQTTNTFKPFLRWEENIIAGKIFGIGVDNSISTTNYTMLVNGVYSASAVARSTGWHKFEFRNESGTVSLRIDGTLISSTVIAMNSNLVKVGANVFAGTNPWGFFDLIQAMLSTIVTFQGFPIDGSGRGLFTPMDQNFSPFFGSANTFFGSTASFSLATAATPSLPFSMYLRVAFWSSGNNPAVENMSKLILMSPLLQVFGGDIFNFFQFDLGRRVPSFKKPRTRSVIESESSNGKDQTILWYTRDVVNLSLTDLTDDQAQALMTWQGTVADGSQFSAAIDSDEVYFGVIQAAVSGGPSTITVDQTSGLNKGMKLMLTKDTGSRFETATVLSFTATTITFTAPLINTYSVLDKIRSSYYWPFCISQDQAHDPVLMNPKVKRWQHSINFKEAL